MTDNSSNFDNLQERNQQVLNNISQLQIQVKTLYDNLDDVKLTSDQKKQIIDKINEISQMRVNMYAGIKDMHSYYQKNVVSSRSTLTQEISAIDVLENELNEAKRKLNLIEDEKNNKLRLVEINTYYGKRYNSHSKLMKIIVFMCIPLIILAVLANRGFLPSNLYAFLAGLIIVIGVMLIGFQIIDISNRDNMNWDEYNWYFNQKDAPLTTGNMGSGSIKNPWATISTTCIGSACCYDGSTYDDVNNICVPNAIYQKTANQIDANKIDAQTKETFRGLEKHGYSQAKPVYSNSVVVSSVASFVKPMF